MADSEVKFIISADGKNAIRVSQEVSNAYKTLASTSIAEIDRKKKEIAAAYETIKKSGVASAQEIARAEKSRNAAIKRANDELLGDHTSLMTKIKNNWLGLSATIAGSMAVIYKGWDLAQTAAQYEQSRQAFKSMAESMGADAEKVFEHIRTLSAGLIDDKSLTESMNRAMSLGIPVEKLGELMQIARAKSRDMGITATQAFNDIATGIGRASPMILDNLGLTLRLGEANEAYAKSVGKTVEQLSDQDKKMAVLNATIEAGKEALSRHNLELLTTKERMDKLIVTVNNLQLIIGQGLIRAVAGAYGAFQWLAAGALSLYSAMMRVGQAYAWVREKTSLDAASKQMYQGIGASAKMNAEAAFKAASDLTGKARENFKAMMASTKDLAAAMAKPFVRTAPTGTKGTGADKYADALRNINEMTTQWRQRIAEMNPELEKQDSEILKLTNSAEDLIRRIEEAGKKGKVDVTAAIADIRAGLEQGKLYITAKLEKEKAEKELKEREKLAEEYRKMASEEAQFAQTENERAINKIIQQEQEKLRRLEEMHQKAAITEEEYQKTRTDIIQNAAAARLEIETQTAKRIADLNYNLIQGIAGMQQWAHELRLEQIEAQAAAYLKDKADPRAVEAWKQDQILRANITKGIKGNDFTAGYKAQLEQYKLDMKTAGEYGAEVFKAQGDAIKESLGSVFHDLREGELKDFADYFKSFADRLLSRWEDMLSEMLTNWMLTGNSMQSSGPGNSGSGGFMNIFGSWGGDGSEGSGILGFISSLFHEGGVGKYDSVMTRVVDPAVFLNAPRFHSGIGPGERPAIIRDDEGVFTPGQMKALGASMAGNTINVPVYLQDDPRLAGRIRIAVEEAIQRELQRVS